MSTIRDTATAGSSGGAAGGRFARAAGALRGRLRPSAAAVPPKAAPPGTPAPAPQAPARRSLWRRTAPQRTVPPAAAADPAVRRSAPRSPVASLLRALIMLVAFAAMVAFAAVLARLTLTPSPASVPISHSNLHPGESLRLYLHQPSVRDAVKQIGGNIVLGVPFGVLMPVLVPRTRGLLRILLATAAVMLLVELVQGAVVQGRSFDIDDVILNTAGSLIGYLLLGRRISRVVHPPRRHWWQRRKAEPDAV
ncbi:VanZ family protein [Streptacidiphilus sp. ASG 303]|uniref:VanZ family protein n=1 Tax=Streptacidiphilus sp. ASG 303 TaxID=2896847 RepID=UPI0035B3801E